MTSMNGEDEWWSSIFMCRPGSSRPSSGVGLRERLREVSDPVRLLLLLVSGVGVASVMLIPGVVVSEENGHLTGGSVGLEIIREGEKGGRMGVAGEKGRGVLGGVFVEFTMKPY